MPESRFPPPLFRQKVDIGTQDDGDMLALSDSQLRAPWEAAACLPIEKRGIFLVRLVAQFVWLAMLPVKRRSSLSACRRVDPARLQSSSPQRLHSDVDLTDIEGVR